MTPSSGASIPEPWWISSLPKDSRGFPVPAEAGWIDGEPAISRVDGDRKIVLGARRGCAVCGYHLAPGSLVYRAWAQADAAHIRGYERGVAMDPAGPVHRSCILYSAIVCPYLRERTARLGKDSGVAPGGRRGIRAAVMGFQNYAFLMPSRPDLHTGSFSDPAFSYLNLVEDIGYRDGSKLVDLYREAIAVEAPNITYGERRLYWAGGVAEADDLLSSAVSSISDVLATDPAFEQVVPGQVPFNAFVM